MSALLVAYFLACPLLRATGLSNGEGPAFRLFEAAVDNTPLRFPLLRYADGLGVQDEFLSASRSRRAARYFDSLPVHRDTGIRECIFGPPPYEGSDAWEYPQWEASPAETSVMNALKRFVSSTRRVLGHELGLSSAESNAALHVDLRATLIDRNPSRYFQLSATIRNEQSTSVNLRRSIPLVLKVNVINLRTQESRLLQSRPKIELSETSGEGAVLNIGATFPPGVYAYGADIVAHDVDGRSDDHLIRRIGVFAVLHSYRPNRGLFDLSAKEPSGAPTEPK
jgi:hypothetical protein